MSFYFPNVDPVYLYKRDGTESNPFIPLQQTLTVKYAKVTLKEIPDFNQKVAVRKANNGLLTEVTSSTLTESQYRVDYSTGMVFFHTSKENEELTFSYLGTGYVNIGANRLILDTSENNNDLVTIQDVLDEQGRIYDRLASATEQAEDIVNLVETNQVATKSELANVSSQLPSKADKTFVDSQVDEINTQVDTFSSQIDTFSSQVDTFSSQVDTFSSQLNAISLQAEKTDSRLTNGAVIKIGIDAAKNAPSAPVIENNRKFYKNISIGGKSLESSTGSYNNIAIGWESLKSATEGEWSNIAIGNESLLNTKKEAFHTHDFAATRNTGIGINALRYNVGGYQNVAVGRNSIQTNEEGICNTAIGANSMYGNAPIDLNGNIVNNTPSSPSHSVAVGFNALGAVSGDNNTAVGSNSALNVKTAINNVAMGRNSLNKLQENLTHDGKNKIITNINGTYLWSGDFITINIPNHNLSNGFIVSLSLLSGDVKSNESSLFEATVINPNSFRVSSPYAHNTNGTVRLNWYTDNVAVTSTSNANTAIGSYSMENSVTALNNTAVGAYSLRTTNGNNNTFLGGLSGINHQTGNNNTGLGYSAMRYMTDGSDATNVSNSTALGFNASVSGDNQVQLGASTTTVYAYGSVQNRSDERDKTDVRDTVLGLEFINRLRPVDFKWDYREDYIDIDESGEVIVNEKDGSKKRVRYHHGLLAQDVQELIEETGIDFGGFQDHSVNDGNDILSLGYTELIAPLIKAVQELSEKVEELESIIKTSQ